MTLAADASDRTVERRRRLAGPVGCGLCGVESLVEALRPAGIPDPVRRAQLVSAELQRLGLDPDTQLLQSFLASSATLLRNQELSVALVGQRTVVTFALGRSDQRRLSTVDAGNGDDFDSIDNIDQQSVSLRLAHRLTQRLSLNAELRRQNTQTSLIAADSRITSVTVGLSARLAPRSSNRWTIHSSQTTRRRLSQVLNKRSWMRAMNRSPPRSWLCFRSSGPRASRSGRLRRASSRCRRN